MPLLGIIGYPLTHSFSKSYFEEKFRAEGLDEWRYENFPLEEIEEFPDLIKTQPELAGLNVTIPWKERVIQYLNELDDVAEEVGAVNTVKVLADGSLKGYNTDVYGFRRSLEEFIGQEKIPCALVLGTGGASKAVQYALRQLGIDFRLVSRKITENSLLYPDVDRKMIEANRLIINATSQGMFPNVNTAPLLHYDYMDDRHFLFDLIYNPETTLFMKKGLVHGAKVKNGFDMLVYQAEKAWEIWNS